jgi:hypothetical protein
MRVLVPVVLALAFAPVASGGLPNPCALVTNAEVAQVLGTKIVERDTSGNRLYRSCKWTGQNLSSSGFYPTQRSLMVEVSLTTKTRFEESARTTKGAIRVTGVGEAAFAMPQGGGGFLYVYAHDYGLNLSASLVTSPLNVEKNAGRIAVKRL